MLGNCQLIDIDHQWLDEVLAQHKMPDAQVIVELDPKQVATQKEVSPEYICVIC